MLGLTKQTPTGLRVFDACRYIIYLTKKKVQDNSKWELYENNVICLIIDQLKFRKTKSYQI